MKSSLVTDVITPATTPDFPEEGMQMEKLILSVLNALGRIEVRGKDNIACMLSCMQALEKVAGALRINRECPGEEASGSPLTPAALEKEEDHA